ncbi:MAG TPA: alpha-amylase family glycosyl hydrolase [Bacteroidales bacterium]|nr:alpha-amylase family glycosyl hydrolase [Bacteroidales bacterium]
MKQDKSFYLADPWLDSFVQVINDRYRKCTDKEKELTGGKSLSEFALGHHFYGLHRYDDGWVLREWAPNATEIYIIGPFSDWKETGSMKMKRINEDGDWELKTGPDILRHGELFKLSVHWDGGQGERLPSYANRVVQDETTKIFSASVWCPARQYTWKHNDFKPDPGVPIIYESHVGMATDEEKTGTFKEFTKNILPYISKAGYNTVQLMAIQEHPFYGSFGYHVANFFSPSSRFGTPEDLKELIDTAHGYGLRVIMDLVHSHSVRNVNEGLGLFDGSQYQYFHTGERRNHVAWDSLCFNYGSNKVLHYLLSNCRYWIEEFRFDGFRFDGVTSMIYFDHGLGKNFGSYGDYFDGGEDEDALVYLYLANKLIHSFSPDALTIAEEMSGMPGLAAPTGQKGFGFDYRLSMGVPDFWIKLVKDIPDESWDMGALVHELSQHRPEERVISYCESHDQALVGDKTLIFRMIDADMYFGMSKNFHNLTIDRGMALHKMIRLLTYSLSGGGYLNFMGNEFGHPEWIDFPREGNNWSYKYAKRQWKLVKNRDLKYHFLGDFDKGMVSLDHNGKLLDDRYINRMIENSSDKVIAYTRGDYLFVYNFHPVRSYTDYGIQITGKFRLVLDTDDESFGGFDRLDKSVIYASVRKAERNTLNVPFMLYLYLPSRTALVFKKEPVKRVTDL